MNGNEPQSGTIFEQTDSGEPYYILRDMAVQLSRIRAILEAGYSVSESLQQQVQETLEAHRQSAEEYMNQVTAEPPPDVYPFVSLPSGTSVKDLSDGNRMFTLADGTILKTNDDHTIAVTQDGRANVVSPGPGTSIEVKPGQVFQLASEWIETTLELAGVSGLPISTKALQISSDRFDIDLSPYRLIVDHTSQSVSVINPSGSIILLGLSRIDGVGEDVAIRVLADNAKGFLCKESGHGGLIENTGTIHLSLKNGVNLIVRFPTAASDSDSESFTYRNLECEERQL